MKKVLLVFLCMIQVSLAFGQGLKPIPQKISDYQQSKKNFASFDLFTADLSKKKAEKYQKAAKDLTVMQLNKSQLSKIVAEKPEAMEMSFPFEGSNVNVKLVRNTILTTDFVVNSNQGKVDYKPGVYYQGIIEGDYTSIVAFSFFDDDVIGVASSLDKGNIVVGKTEDSNDFVSYNDYKLTGKNPFRCGVDQIPDNYKNITTFDPTSVQNVKMTANCVRVYFEIGYGPYTQNGSNETTTMNWITGMFNNIKTLYNNDDVNIAMSEVYIWKTADPYSGQPGDILQQFRNARQSLTSDIGQLVRNPSTTSIAYLNSLCTNNRHSYSGVNKAYSNVPTYSWNIEAMTHEMGHNLGSPHTHDCFWNGDNTAIDGCGTAAGDEVGCPGPLPSDGGTIMSYCHLVSVGINFAKGFGPQPGTLIRNTIDSKACLGTNCTTSCTTTVSNTTVNNITVNSAQVNITDNTSTSWKYKLVTYGGEEVRTGTTSTKNFVLDNLHPGSFYQIFVSNGCSGAYERNVLFYTDADWCTSGINFMDPGGETGNYPDGLNLTKTFYPSSGSKLKLNFTEFNVATGDYMLIYDGPSIGSPRFEGGTNVSGTTIPGPFTATNAQGAITIRFISSGSGNSAGWKANFECISLAVNESNANNNVNITPNPTKGIVNITSVDNIVSVEVTDISGRKISTTGGKGLHTKTNTLDLSKNVAGTYLITVKTDKETITKKVIKY